MYALTAAGMPDGGMIATAADLARFMDALAAPGTLLSDSLKAMMTPHSTPGGEGGTYGYGFEMVLDGNRTVLIGHGDRTPEWQPWSTTTRTSI